MRYRYFDDFRRVISVFAIFSNGIAELGLRPFLIQTEVTFQLHRTWRSFLLTV